MICIYHNKDLDGICSGAIVKRKYPDAKFYGYDYGQEFDISQLPEKEPVIIIDVSFDIPKMFELAKHSGWQPYLD